MRMLLWVLLLDSVVGCAGMMSVVSAGVDRQCDEIERLQDRLERIAAMEPHRIASAAMGAI